MAENEEKQRLQQTDSISSDSTVAPGGGHDNKAYDPDESGSSMASSPVTSKKEAAVNMEMADLTPPQHPKIMTNSEKMKDFYVSVNEHKKGIRGEKLYVTKDNREMRHNNCRSVVCITVVVLFLAAAVAVATLIGVDIIDPMQIQKQVGIYRDDREREITTGQTPIQQEIISSASNLNNLSTDKNEELFPEEFPSSAVKNAYEGQLTISNLAWDPRYSNPQSNFFKVAASQLEVALDSAMITRQLRDEAVFHFKITHFEAGSVVPHFRLSWMPRNDPSYVVPREALMRHFDREMALGNLLADIYSVQPQSLKFGYLDDKCRNMMWGAVASTTMEIMNLPVLVLKILI
jgi:hypothetical protein